MHPQHDALILAIETSCDDTAAAVVRGSAVYSNIISSQPIHNDWGGIVPELASREHVKAIGHIVQAAMREASVGFDQLDAIAVTNGPGLPGSLLVGTQFAKGLALRLNCTLIPIHHIEAHVYSGYLEDPSLPFPSICLVVSGGHTAIFHVTSWHDHVMVGSTRDDAAGEAFDKVSKMMGLGYPGGPVIDRLAQQGNRAAFTFPQGLKSEAGFDFSFSGLKTAVRRTLDAIAPESRTGALDGGDHAPPSVRTLPPTTMADVAASVQGAIVDVLVHKTTAAASQYNVASISIAGGVSANSELRIRMQQECSRHGWQFVAPRGQFCVDNAAMIGFVAAQKLRAGIQGTMNFSAVPRAMRAR